MATPNLAIPGISAGQSQKEVTSNEADNWLDEATQDTIDIDASAGGTITLTADQFRKNFLIRLTGAPGGAFNIDVPDGKRFFAIDNQSGQQATIDTVTAGTTVVVAAGDNATVYSKGTDLIALVSAGGGGLSNVVDDTTPQLGGALDTNAFAIDESEAAAVASATTTDVWATDGNTVHVTGATTITGFGTAPRAGAWRKVIFDGILTLTDGANLNLPGGANITTAADDFAFVYAETTALFKVLYFKADGTPVAGGGGLSNLVEDTTPQLGGPLDVNGNNITMPGSETVDGRDLSVDGTKLDGVSAGAEVNPDLISQADAEAGTATAERIFSALRVKQAIDALGGGGGGGKVLQVVNTQTGAVATGTTVVADDDSIPQNTEGDEYMTLVITPKNTANTLIIEVVIVLASSGSSVNLTAALFQDTTANALAAMSIRGATINQPNEIVFTHKMIAGTTSATTFKVRAGAVSAGTTTFNGKNAGRLMGGAYPSSITITEIAA